MAPSRRDNDPDQPRGDRPAADDPVLRALHEAKTQYGDIYQRLEHQKLGAQRELGQLREQNERFTQQLAVQRVELDHERRRAERKRETADTLAAALKDIQYALFSGNIYDLILKTCITLTGATRGLYITTSGADESLRVRAAIAVEHDPAVPPSPLVAELCRSVVESQKVLLCSDMAGICDQASETQGFRNCVAAPAVLRSSLSGVVIVADKAGGDFDQADADVMLSVGSQAAVAIENTRLQREVHEAYLSIVALLAQAMAARNSDGERAQEARCRHARVVAGRLGMSEYEQSIVYYAALLHDVGNIGVSEGVFNKPGPLLPAERELIRTHVQIGRDLLCQIPVLESVAQVVGQHHERYDGGGYPDGLQGDEILLAARIVAVVDAYGAMLARRSYRSPRTQEEACLELQRAAGSQFDPQVVDAFLATLDAAHAEALTDAESSELTLHNLDATQPRPPSLVSR